MRLRFPVGDRGRRLTAGGSCDTHLHVIGDRRRSRFRRPATTSRPKPPDAPFAALLAHLDELGVDRGDCSAGICGFDNSCLLDALRQAGNLARSMRFADLDDQVRATDLIFASDAAWTVVRGSDLGEGPSRGLPVWARHVGDPVLASNLTRRTDFALFMVAALEDDTLIREAPAIVSRESASAHAHAAKPPVGEAWPFRSVFA